MGVRKERAWSLERSSYLTGTPSDSYDIDRIYYDTSSYYSASSVSVSISGLLGRKKSSSRPFKDHYADWRSVHAHFEAHFDALDLAASSVSVSISGLLGRKKSSSLPYDLLDSSVRSVHAHFEAHFDALDLAARHDPCQLLHPGPSLRSPLESPFLFLGGIHPGLLTALLRSFLLHPRRGPPRPFPFDLAWADPPRGRLLARLDQIERGLRLLVPTLLSRVREAQAAFVESAAAEWAAGADAEGEGDGAVAALVEELGAAIADANRLRRSVLGEMVAAMDVCQGALFLEALSQFVVGLRDPDVLRDFEQTKIMPPSPPPS
ncbi:protein INAPERTURATE POLLEN1 [Ananas comosus]|uniref:Protein INAPERTURATE POLLEN1 n=1 Tax=Ananas comosus TaxID=4615 RepID=A0A6P5FPF7_ANACO|nr:protein INAPERTURATE POLLEN1 [Ananas comosus]